MSLDCQIVTRHPGHQKRANDFYFRDFSLSLFSCMSDPERPGATGTTGTTGAIHEDNGAILPTLSDENSED